MTDNDPHATEEYAGDANKASTVAAPVAADSNAPDNDTAGAVSSTERITKSFDERKDTIQLDINDKTNSAEVVKKPSLGTSNVSLQSTGAM